MRLIVGLGNTGEKFKGTRHNVGREIIVAFCVSRRRLDTQNAGFPNFRFEKKWNALVAEVPKPAKRAGIPAAKGGLGRKIILLLPETFVNKSGAAVAPAARFFKIKPRDVFLVHDDVDLPMGRAKLSFGAHSAGHKGVESVLRALKTRDLWRFRIGIGKPAKGGSASGGKKIPAEKLVLKKFSPDETKAMKKVFKKTIEAIRVAVTEKPEIAMNEYNR